MLYSRYRQLSRWQERGHHPEPLSNEALEEEKTCLNCGTRFAGNYCPNCGQTTHVKRLSIRNAVMDFVDIFTNFDSGFIHTCLELAYRPGHMIRDYINGHRREYVKPVQLVFLLGTVMLLAHYSLYGNGYESDEVVSQESLEGLNDKMSYFLTTTLTWLWNNHAILYLCIVGILVIPNYFVFRLTEQGKKMNLAEHFYTMVYVACQLMMLDLVQMPFDRFFAHSDDVNLGVPLLLLVYDFHQLCRISYRKSVLLCLLSNLLALGSSFVIAVVLYMIFIGT